MRQLQCSCCGWKGELDPDGTMYFGPGGTLSCPACEEAKRNGPGIESSYGNVRSVDVPPFKRVANKSSVKNEVPLLWKTYAQHRRNLHLPKLCRENKRWKTMSKADEMSFSQAIEEDIKFLRGNYAAIIEHCSGCSSLKIIDATLAYCGGHIGLPCPRHLKSRNCGQKAKE